jgi:hypothetical protein
MGQELDCRLLYQGRDEVGRAQLETDYILFRGTERLKIALPDLRKVSARDGLLHLEFPGGPAALELGAAAEKWAEKILHPPSRADKLGVKAGLLVRVEGEFPADFLEELRALEYAGKAKADLIFFAADTARELKKTAKLVQGLKPSGALWTVYPKGASAIREIDVIEAGRGAGMKDTKVAAFSKTHTALRFVIPVADRVRSRNER